MANIDILRYGIVVILNEAYYGTATPNTPLDMEGRVLTLMLRSGYAQKLIDDGRLLDLLCNPEYNGSVDAYIRWENDVRDWYTGGTLVFRRGNVSRCNSIWEEEYIDHNHGIQIDTRPWEELHPSTTKPLPQQLLFDHKYHGHMTWTTAPAEPAEQVFGNLYSLPTDGNFHKVSHQGVIGHARMQSPGVYEFQEDHLGADIQIIHTDPETPEPPQQVQSLEYMGDGTVVLTMPNGEQHTITDMGNITTTIDNTQAMELTTFGEITVDNNATIATLPSSAEIGDEIDLPEDGEPDDVPY